MVQAWVIDKVWDDELQKHLPLVSKNMEIVFFVHWGQVRTNLCTERSELQFLKSTSMLRLEYTGFP